LKSEESAFRKNLVAIDRYFFDQGSPTTLGVFRILIGSLAVINMVMLALDWEDWFGERGFIPEWMGRLWLGPDIQLGMGTDLIAPRLNPLVGVTNPTVVLGFYSITLIAALFTALGLWTRASTIVLAVGTVTLQHRNPIILHGGDSVLRIMVVYLAIAPCGAACSMDRMIALWKGKMNALPVQVSLWPQRLITYNVSLIYFTTVWLKYFGDDWRTGVATWYPARLAEFQRFPVPDFINQFPFVKFTTYGTLFIEFAMATLVFFRPFRKYVILGAICLHSYIEYSMNIPLFSFLMMSCYICYFEGEEVATWAERFGSRLRRWHVNVRVPAGTRLRANVAAVLDSMDPFKLVHYLHGETAAWSADNHAGKPLPVVRAIATRSLGAWPFAWIPGVMKRILAHGTEPIPEEIPATPVEAKSEPRSARKKVRK